ncbi:hypothetical protein PTMSG1_06132 [Pyrenophora teres f. maculata]|nr:hypothetical protein PTMSG1_06132 [Pyrenophora teres f. maculata]
MEYQLFLDRLGWTYVSIFIVWNVLLASGLTFLWLNRQHPTLRMRRLPVLFTGIISLHIYGNICCLAYPFGAAFPCSVVFWMMSIAVPLGMALFHASNSQFLHLASRQKRFAHMSSLKDHEPIDEKKAQEVSNSRWKRIMKGVERADNIERTLIFIGMGMIAQVALVLFVFLASEKFHPGFGIFDYTIKGTGMEATANCVKGWEWWLSIVWQLFWSWVYAPWILFKSRSIKDVHGWRLQTICCCLVGLPASPLWLAGLYAPQFAPFSAVFPPPVWFAVCFSMMEVFSIGFPIVNLLRSKRLAQETIDAIADWETRQAAAGLNDTTNQYKTGDSLTTTITVKSSGDFSYSQQSFESHKSDILTMTALENALRTNALPLLEFAALKDFSGENVSFLTHVADWRRYWFTPKSNTAEHRRQQFVAATRIYAHFISLEFSEFPINISSKEMKRLHVIFSQTANFLYSHRQGSITSSLSDKATPFDNVMPDDASDSPFNSDSDRSNSSASSHELKVPASPMSPATPICLDRLGRANLKAVSNMEELNEDAMLAEVEIPGAFTEMIFDAAEKEIKYLVLTNTWPKFVNLGRANSQITKDSDAEKGNAWMRKLLCN